MIGFPKHLRAVGEKLRHPERADALYLGAMAILWSSARANVGEPERLAHGDLLWRAQARLRVGDLLGARAELVRAVEARAACPEGSVCRAAEGRVGKVCMRR